MKKKSVSLALFIFGFISQFVFADVEFLSPIPGKWGNKQMLIINNDSEGDYFYSIDGSDPEKVGFAYDGPVLLDITGDVELRVTHIAVDGAKDYGTVKYSVTANDGKNKNYSDLISKFYDTGVYEYNIQGPVSIPSDLFYSLEINPVNYISGRELSLSEDSILSLIVPCSLYDKRSGQKWRFIIRTLPQVSGVFEKRDVPFKIRDWETIEFTDYSLIYKIDSELCDSDVNFVTVDRSVPHMISWKKADLTQDYLHLPDSSGDNLFLVFEGGSQSDDEFNFDNTLLADVALNTDVGVKSGSELQSGDEITSDEITSNEIQSDSDFEFFILPTKPEVKFDLQEDGSGIFSVDGDASYSLGINLNGNTDNAERFSEICVDAFYGNKISGSLTFGLYSDTVYQGDISLGYVIDKLPPLNPAFISSAKTFYSKKSVDVDVNGVDNADLYVAVSEPFEIKNSNIIYKENNPIFNNVKISDFSLVDGNSTKISLEPIKDKVVYYKVLAYSQKNNIKGAVSEYSVILDQSCYYYDRSAKVSLGEGTLLNPFNSFQQFVDAIKNTNTASLKVKGDLYIDKKYEINTDIEIRNDNKGRVIFGPNGSLEFNDSIFYIADCRMHKISSSSVDLVVPFIQLNNSTLYMNNCQISGNFSRNGTIIDSVNSVVNVSDSIVSVSADSYASFISSISSDVNVDNSIVSITADTGVVFSSSKGNSIIDNNIFKVSGNTGRIAELFGEESVFKNNQFKVELSNFSRTFTFIYADKNTDLTEEGNTQIGF